MISIERIGRIGRIVLHAGVPVVVRMIRCHHAKPCTLKTQAPIAVIADQASVSMKPKNKLASALVPVANFRERYTNASCYLRVES
ncbi:hypothetical protein EV128_108192 [Rhizobium azibense]|nr:hypothetical protein EV128_108192 [Rhizobium azibense]